MEKKLRLSYSQIPPHLNIGNGILLYLLHDKHPGNAWLWGILWFVYAIAVAYNIILLITTDPGTADLKPE